MNSRLNFAIAIAGAAALGTPGAMGTYIDAFGDAQDTFGAGPPLLDIDAVHVLYDETTLFVEVTFHNTISAASLNLPDSVIGAIDLDTDQNPATGTSPLQNPFSPPFAFLLAGIDFYLELEQEIIDPGFIGLFSGETFELIALLPIMFDTMSFSTEVPLALLNDDDGVLDFTVLFGTFAQPTDATDFVATSKAVPAPGVLALLGIAAMSGRRRRHR